MTIFDMARIPITIAILGIMAMCMTSCGGSGPASARDYYERVEWGVGVTKSGDYWYGPVRFKIKEPENTTVVIRDGVAISVAPSPTQYEATPAKPIEAQK